MKSFIVIISLLGLIGSASAGFQNCAAIPAGPAFFNLCPFAQDSTFTISETVGLDTLNLTLGNDHQTSCDGSTQVWATLQQPSACIDIGTYNPTYSLVNSSDSNSGLLISFPLYEYNVTNAANITTTTNYSLTVQLSCDMSLTQTASTTFSLSESINTNLTHQYFAVGASRYGCPAVSFNLLIDFFANNPTFFAILFGVIGVVLTFFGLRFVNFTIFVIVTILGTATVGSLFFEFVDLSTSHWLLWVVFGVSVIAGATLGYLALRFEKVAFFLVGGALGLVGGLLLYTAIISPIIKDHSGITPLYVTLIIAVILGGVLGLLLIEDILIFATGIIGAYLSVRAVSVFLGGFPSETDVANGFANFTAVTYAYLAAIIILAIAGIYCQFHLRPSKKDKDLEDEHMPLAGAYYGNTAYKY